jgi:hypothetical protein
MMKKIRDRLCIFSGEDFSIIRKCEPNIQFYFSLIGGFVLAILICCFISAFLFTDSLFHNSIQDFGIAIIWGFVVTNLYVLLLYTISPTFLPTSIKKSNLKVIESKGSSINASFILRIILLIILAIIISQPLNVALLSNSNNTYASTIKMLLSTNVLAWLITSLVAVIFLLPVYWKYSIRNLGGFYEVKANIEKRIIEDDYIDFKRDFKRLLENNISDFNKKTWENTMPFLNKLEIVSKEKYNNLFSEITTELQNENIEKYEYWADPPFRTIKKNNTTSALSEEDFLTDIYNN